VRVRRQRGERWQGAESALELRLHFLPEEVHPSARRRHGHSSSSPIIITARGGLLDPLLHFPQALGLLQLKLKRWILGPRPLVTGGVVTVVVERRSSSSSRGCHPAGRLRRPRRQCRRCRATRPRPSAPGHGSQPRTCPKAADARRGTDGSRPPPPGSEPAVARCCVTTVAAGLGGSETEDRERGRLPPSRRRHVGIRANGASGDVVVVFEKVCADEVDVLLQQGNGDALSFGQVT
jgi:hypothetical protein